MNSSSDPASRFAQLDPEEADRWQVAFAVESGKGDDWEEDWDEVLRWIFEQIDAGREPPP